MPVRSVLLSSIIVVAAIGTAGPSSLRAQSSNPLKTDPFHDSMRARAALPAEFGAGEGSDLKDAGLKDRVASAIRPLDLHKLSMSDFGDVEQPR